VPLPGAMAFWLDSRPLRTGLDERDDAADLLREVDAVGDGAVGAIGRDPRATREPVLGG
jgi:hypothetical protein